MYKSDKSDFYVYTLAFPHGEVFYVGKGCHNRIHDHERQARSGGGSGKCQTIRYIWDTGRQVVKSIVYKDLTEDRALDLETQLIYKYGIENLTNRPPRNYYEYLRVLDDLADSLEISNAEDLIRIIVRIYEREPEEVYTWLSQLLKKKEELLSDTG